VSFRDIFRRPRPATPAEAEQAASDLADFAVLRRLDRLALRTQPWLRGQSAGQRPSRRRIPSTDFREHRQYLPGDDLRHVDWNASARSEHVFVKMGERPREATIHVLVDHTASMAWGQPSKLGAARRLAVALGYLALNHGDHLMVGSLADPAPRFGPSHGTGRVPGLLRFVRTLKPVRSADMLKNARAYAASQPRGGLVVLISDLLAMPDVGALVDLFPAPYWQPLMLHLLHPLELDPAPIGEVEFQDVETHEKANYDLDAYALERYHTFIGNWCEALEGACFQRGAAYARVLADWESERAVVPYLRRRGVVQPV
jgi:uncharacterized protein (DUF58 family)